MDLSAPTDAGPVVIPVHKPLNKVLLGLIVVAAALPVAGSPDLLGVSIGAGLLGFAALLLGLRHLWLFLSPASRVLAAYERGLLVRHDRRNLWIPWGDIERLERTILRSYGSESLLCTVHVRRRAPVSFSELTAEGPKTRPLADLIERNLTQRGTGHA